MKMSFRPILSLLLATILASATCGAVAAQENLVWVSMGRDLFDHLSTPGALPPGLSMRAYDSNKGVVVTRLPERALQAVSTASHETFRRCGGFIVHESLEDATLSVKAAQANYYKTLPSDFTINKQPIVNALLPLLNKTNILNTIDHLSTSYTNRYYQYTSGQQSALWIRDLWLGYANGRSDITVEAYNHGSYVQPSVIMTIDGGSLASEIVVLGGHLDSIRSGGMSTGTVAPGADDDASGIATISEVIRVLMNDGFTPDRTVKFMGYAAEEVGLRGSGDIAADHQTAGADVVAVMQLDMTDYMGSVEDIVLMDDYTNADLSTFVGDLADTYLPSLLWTYSTCGYGCSDHASWYNRGYPTVMPFESRMSQYNPTIHTSNDTLATLGNQTDHALKFAKLALSFIIETSLADCTPAPVADAGLDRSINEGSSTTIGTPALAGHTYSWTPGGATTAQVLVTPPSTTTYTVTATTSCGSAQDSVTVTVVPPGQNGPQTAVYDSGLGAPKCAVPGSSCDSTTLLNGRANLGPEPNQPNTLGSCTDGTSGSYHSDESNDKIVVTNLSGTNFSEGDTVRIDATVYAYSTGSSDRLDLYYTADANNPSWTYLTTLTPPGGGVRTLSATYTLPSGTLQAVRANFRYQGSAVTCPTGNYDDTDDLVFAVEDAGCTVNADCDDGLWCNGAETCSGGVCQPSTVPPNCDDGISCTVDGCNEGTNSCDHTPDDGQCDDGLFCNGAETCSVTLDCQAGSDPCGAFGCDEVGDICLSCNVNADCDDGLFCNGAETCASGFCQAGSDPCPGQSCDEVGDVCVPVVGCTVDDDFEAGAPSWSNDPASTCSTGAYVTGNPTNPGSGRQIVGSHSGTTSIFTAVNTSAGVNDVDGGNCILGSPTWAVASASTLSVWYWHGQRDAGDDPSGDFFRLEYSTNGGSTWTTMVSIGDVTSSPSWAEATASVPAGSNVKVRVQCSDGSATGDLVECGIDDVSICPQ